MSLTAILFPGQGSQSDPAVDHGLAVAITSPVRWRETILEAHRMGAERFVEVGPGRVLAGLVKCTLSGGELVHA